MTTETSATSPFLVKTVVHVVDTGIEADRTWIGVEVRAWRRDVVTRLWLDEVAAGKFEVKADTSMIGYVDTSADKLSADNVERLRPARVPLDEAVSLSQQRRLVIQDEDSTVPFDGPRND